MADAFNDTQLRTLAIIPHITGIISTIASCYVLQDILRDPKKRTRTYCRLVFGMAAIDFLTSLMYAFSTLPMERDEAPYGVYALGNHATCSTQAFLIQMEIASPIYHFYLAWYYLLILKYRWPERKFRGYEKYLHGFALVFALATSIILLPLGVYGEFFVWCWITNVEGNGYYQWFFFFGPLWFIILASSVVMYQMCVHVKAEETVSRRWRNSIVDTSKLGEKKLKKMTSRVFWQAMHYELAFYATWTIPTISQTLLQLANVKPSFGMQLANAIFTPLAGFFNFTIYVRPRYIKYMEDNKKEMWWYILWKAIKHSVPSRKMKVEIVSVNFDDDDDDENEDFDPTNRKDDDNDLGGGNHTNRIDDDDDVICGNDENETENNNKKRKGRKNNQLPTPDTKAYGIDMSGSIREQSINHEELKHKKEERKTEEGEPDYGYEDPDAPSSIINMHPSGSMRRQNSHSIMVMDYEEDDVGVMDPALALERLFNVDTKLKMMSLPKKGGKKVYKLVKKVNKGVKKRRRSLMGSVSSLLGLENPPSGSLKGDDNGP
ncbi:unnamed protein product [Cylindrotheca closterium]|uniref:Uncharacterized protein n=1 Tax=Cylindrotheca closterium TaxID=2856 RepID=A0AAD2FWM3_9STRA|nr:unnamed protein product [Cylindrotheca closterium]